MFCPPEGGPYVPARLEPSPTFKCGAGVFRVVINGGLVGSIALKLDGGQTKTLKIQLKRKTRIALSKDADKKLAAKVKITAKDAAGVTAKSSKKLNLKG